MNVDIQLSNLPKHAFHCQCCFYDIVSHFLTLNPFKALKAVSNGNHVSNENHK